MRRQHASLRQPDRIWSIPGEKIANFEIECFRIIDRRMIHNGNMARVIAPYHPRNKSNDALNETPPRISIRQHFTQRKKRLRWNRFEHHIWLHDLPISFDLLQPRLHDAQSLHFFLNRLLDLGFTQGQHPPHLLGRGISGQQASDLFKREAKFFQNENAIEPGQLPRAVIAVPRLWVGEFGTEKTDLIVISQQAARDLGDLGEITNTKHACFSLFRLTLQQCQEPDLLSANSRDLFRCDRFHSHNYSVQFAVTSKSSITFSRMKTGTCIRRRGQSCTSPSTLGELEKRKRGA